MPPDQPAGNPLPGRAVSRPANDAGARAWAELVAALEAHVHLLHARPRMLVEHAGELHSGAYRVVDEPPGLVCWLATLTGKETFTGGGAPAPISVSPWRIFWASRAPASSPFSLVSHSVTAIIPPAHG